MPLDDAGTSKAVCGGLDNLEVDGHQIAHPAHLCQALDRGRQHLVEVAKGFQLMELATRKANRRPGPVLPRAPLDFVLPPAPPGYITPDDLQSIQGNPEEEVPQLLEGTIESIQADKAVNEIADITSYLGPVRIILLLLDGGRRERASSEQHPQHSEVTRWQFVSWA